MDPYDAILEQLKRAQARGLEAVTNRLDFVTESLDELIQEAKSSVQEAVPHEAEELFPVAELETAVGELRDRTVAAEATARELELETAALRQSLAAAEEEGPPGVSIDLLRRLDAPRSQSELLKELLPVLVEHVGRAVVLVIRGQAISAWSGIGFVEIERLRDWQGELSGSENLQRFVHDSSAVRFAPADDALFSRWLGDEPSTEAYLFPVCLRGKVMGAIYADRVDERPWNPELAQGLVALTCWLIDTLHYRQTVPSPMLAEPVDLVTAEAPPREPTPEPGAVFEEPPVSEPAPAEEALEIDEEPAPAMAPPVEEVPEEPVPEAEAVEEPEAEVEAVEEPALEPEEPEPAEELELAEPVPDVEAVEMAEQPAAAETPGFDPSATVRVDVPSPPPPEVVEPPVVEPVQPPAEPEPEPEPEPAAEPELTPEEEARHEEARRFARLLVSEIKLYNEEEVERGRASRDLYLRLKEDIDRSQEMYEKRIPPEVREVRDYFHDELVRILADSDPDALGM